MKDFPNNVIFLEDEFGNQSALDKVFFLTKLNAFFTLPLLLQLENQIQILESFFDNNVGQMLTLLNKMIDYGCMKLIFSFVSSNFWESSVIAH